LLKRVVSPTDEVPVVSHRARLLPVRPQPAGFAADGHGRHRVGVFVVADISRIAQAELPEPTGTPTANVTVSQKRAAVAGAQSELFDSRGQSHARGGAASRARSGAQLAECVVTPTTDAVIGKQRASVTVTRGDLNGRLPERHG
jgi:hypothetical protein